MIKPSCHTCIFDWTHQGDAVHSGHCVIYPLPPKSPGLECLQYVEVAMIPPKTDEQIDAQIVTNRIRYETDLDLKAMADTIHIDRMGAGAACDNCICLAIALLDAKKEKKV